MGNRLANGPLRAQLNEFYSEYAATRGQALHVKTSARICFVNQGGTADKRYSSLTESIRLSWAFFVLQIPRQRLLEGFYFGGNYVIRIALARRACYLIYLSSNTF